MTKGQKLVCEGMKNGVAKLRACIIAYTSGDLLDSDKKVIENCIYNNLNWINEGIAVLLGRKTK